MKVTMLLAASCLVCTTGVGLAARAAKPPANPTATVTFLNAGSDNIQGDGSVYTGGVSGVVAELQGGSTPDGTWSGPTDLLLNIVRTTSKPKRFLLYKYPESAKVDLSGELSSSEWPCSSYPGATGPTSSSTGVKVAGYVNIHSLGQIQIGEARAVRVHFGADAGQFLWLSPHNVTTGSCSSTVVAYRQTQTTWYVSPDVSRMPGVTSLGESAGVRFNDQVGSYEVRGTSPGWWDFPSAVAQLEDAPSLGNYLMPFALTVSCPKCPPPPACATGKGCEIGF